MKKNSVKEVVFGAICGLATYSTCFFTYSKVDKAYDKVTNETLEKTRIPVSFVASIGSAILVCRFGKWIFSKIK